MTLRASLRSPGLALLLGAIAVSGTQLAGIGTAQAQTRKPAASVQLPAASGTVPSAPAPEPPAAPYEDDLLRLAEIMGALAFLRDLCGKTDATQWHQQMAQLLEAEGTSKGRRARLAGAYNRGFRGFETSYRSCTANAELAIERYLEEGRTIARNTASRYSG